MFMNTLNKILKQHAEVYDPHRQIWEFLRNNNKSYLIVILIVLEGLTSIYLINANNEPYGFIILFVYSATIAASSYWHFKQIENLYGSLENLEIEKMKRFIQLTLNKVNVKLYSETENILIESMISEKLEKVHRLEQAKKTVYLGIITTILPLFISLIAKNLNNIKVLTITVMGFGLIILFFSFKSAFKEYALISKLEHTSEILKEIRLTQLISNRNSDVNP
jgi:hypothetical protein